MRRPGRFGLQDGVLQFPFDATAGRGFVWHCPIRERDDNDMMRRYKVVKPAVPAQALNSHPDSFNPVTQIAFRLPYAGPVDVRIFNLPGQEVRRLVSREKTAGEHTIRWDGRDDGGLLVAGGIHFYRLETPDFKKTKRMLFLK